MYLQIIMLISVCAIVIIRKLILKRLKKAKVLQSSAIHSITIFV